MRNQMLVRLKPKFAAGIETEKEEAREQRRKQGVPAGTLEIKSLSTQKNATPHNSITSVRELRCLQMLQELVRNKLFRRMDDCQVFAAANLQKCKTGQLSFLHCEHLQFIYPVNYQDLESREPCGSKKHFLSNMGDLAQY